MLDLFEYMNISLNWHGLDFNCSIEVTMETDYQLKELILNKKNVNISTSVTNEHTTYNIIIYHSNRTFLHLDVSPSIGQRLGQHERH